MEELARELSKKVKEGGLQAKKTTITELEQQVEALQQRLDTATATAADSSDSNSAAAAAVAAEWQEQLANAERTASRERETLMGLAEQQLNALRGQVVELQQEADAAEQKAKREQAEKERTEAEARERADHSPCAETAWRR